MQGLVDSCIVVLLTIIVFQDLKERQISWFLIPLLLCSFVVKGLFSIPFSELQHYSLFNSGFIVIQLIALTAYMSLKNKKLTNIINSYLGVGDVLFFIVICVAFSPLNFILFYVLSLIITLTGYFAYIVLVKKTMKEIPLAGAMAMTMIALIVLSQFIPQFNFYNDNYLTGWLIIK